MKNLLVAFSLAAIAGLALLTLKLRSSDADGVRDRAEQESSLEDPLRVEHGMGEQMGGGSSMALPTTAPGAEREALASAQPVAADLLASKQSLVQESIDGEFPISFRVPVGAGAGSIHFLLDGSSEPEFTTLGPAQEEAIATASEGHWTAFFKNEAGEVGPVVTFDVTTEGQVVELAAPGSFELAMQVINWRTKVPLSGVAVEIVRSDLPALLVAAANVELSPSKTTSDAAGHFEYPGVQYGTYRFTADHSGFESEDFTLDLPGRFAEQLTSAGKADLGELGMYALVAFPVQLVGFQDWGGAEGFSIAHTHSGDKVAFDVTGMATLELGWYSSPLYLKWWYPTEEQVGIAYLDGGFPREGEPWLIDVGKGLDLDVDLRISDSLHDQIDTTDATLRATAVTTRGDSLMQAVNADGAGVFTIQGVAGRFAMVEFVAKVDGKEVSLGLERVKLQDGQRSSCVLSIETLPTQLTFVDAAGKSVPGAYLELRELDSTTGWTFGGPADSSGQLKVAIPPHLELSMRVSSMDESLLAVDCPVSWIPGLPQITVPLASAGSCSLNVQKNGDPASGIGFDLFGAHSSNKFDRLQSDDTGRTKPFDIVSGSTARLRLQSDSLWMPQPFIEVRPGETKVQVYDVGFLTLDPTVDASDILHMKEGQNLASWIEAGLVSSVPGSPRSFQVPVGQYRMIRDGEVVWEQPLLAEETVIVGSTPR